MVSTFLQALVTTGSLDVLRFTYLPTGKFLHCVMPCFLPAVTLWAAVLGTISARVASLDDAYQSMCTKWLESYSGDSGTLRMLHTCGALSHCKVCLRTHTHTHTHTGVLQYIENAGRVIQMPIAQVMLHRPSSTEQR